MSVQITVTKEIEKLQNSIKREGALKDQLANYNALLDHINEMEEQSKPLPEDVSFANYEDWKNYVEKKMKSRTTSIATVGKNRDLLVALETYLEQNPEE